MQGFAKKLLPVAAATICAFAAPPASADYEADVSYDQLASELGPSVPDGSGVQVSIVEAATEVGADLAWLPNLGIQEFANVTITDMSGAVPGVYSSHATAVGRNYFGSITSTSPGITEVLAYWVDHWLLDGFLNVYTGGLFARQPQPAPARITNHSWIGSAGGLDGDALARLDWVTATDEALQVAGFTGSTTSPLLSSAYNVISVNSTSLPTDVGSAAAGGVYTAGRTRPDLVAPASSPSSATPRVASAAALLLGAGHDNPAWSGDPVSSSVTNRNGDTIYNAERIEVVKAALMAGADRFTDNSTSADISDYRSDPADRTSNGLDRRFGAGQLNIYGSYQIIAAGEQNSAEDQAGGAGLVASAGFDYDPAFGGSNRSNTVATYYLPTDTGMATLKAALVWNLDVDGGSSMAFDGSASLYNLDLKLFDVTDPNNWVLAASSTSSIDNTENLWEPLDSGKNYAIRVERGPGQAAFRWDYGLAWQVLPYEPPFIETAILAQGRVNQVYPDQHLIASGGQLPYEWSVIWGRLPAGLTLSVDGILSGTPTESASNTVLVEVTDARGSPANRAFNIEIESGSSNCCPTCHGAGSF